MFAVPVGGRGFYQTVPNEVEHTIENPDVEWKSGKGKRERGKEREASAPTCQRMFHLPCWFLRARRNQLGRGVTRQLYEGRWAAAQRPW